MVDMLPFPRMMGNTTEEKMADMLNYLIQFKETLEFILANISTENLSPELINKLNELGADIEKNNESRENEISQITANALTIYDVCNSEIFRDAIISEMNRSYAFNVNFETGHLEYATEIIEGG